MVVHFPDVSHYQLGLDLRGAPLVIAKATQGSSFTDWGYVEFKAQAASLGIPFAAYHWVDASPVGQQALHCFDVVGRDVPVMWDAEAPGSTVERLVQLTGALRRLGGNPRLVYLPHWWWQGHIGSPDLRPLADLGLSLISSAYPREGYTDHGEGWEPYGGMAPAIWQYTNARPFNGRRVDFNAYRGSLDQLVALLTGQPATHQEDEMTPAQEYTLHVLNYRIEALRANRPSISVPPFTASNGQKFPAIQEANQLALALAAIQAAITAPAGPSDGLSEAELAAAYRAAADKLDPPSP